MPEIPTPTLEFGHFIPTPTPFVSVIATPTAPGAPPSSVATVDFTVHGTGLVLVIAVGMIIAGCRKLSRRRN